MCTCPFRASNLAFGDGKAILLIRNPYDAVISLWTHMFLDGEFYQIWRNILDKIEMCYRLHHIADTEVPGATSAQSQVPCLCSSGDPAVGGDTHGLPRRHTQPPRYSF